MRIHLTRRVTLVSSLFLTFGFCFLIILIECSNAVIERAARNKVFSDIESIPYNEVAVVLGCSDKLSNGRENLYFKYRIDTAAELVNAAKCQYVLVSGDNGEKTYDEPSEMRDALIAKGVPKEQIVLDYAGFSTLDSVLRAEVIFGLKSYTIVSQEFHNQRACYIAKQHGLSVSAINAHDVSSFGGLKTKLRERLARVKTILDIHILHSRPKFTGPREKTPWNV